MENDYEKDPLEDFDFHQWDEFVDVGSNPCKYCDTDNGKDGCDCSGERFIDNHTFNRIWKPDLPPDEKNPKPRAEWKFSIEPDYDKYREILLNALEAKPCLSDYVDAFDWENGTTLEFEDHVQRLMEVPVISHFLQVMRQSEDPLNNFCNKNAEMTPPAALPYPDPTIEEIERTGGRPKCKDSLQYLNCNWFKQSYAIFQVHIAQLMSLNPDADFLIHFSDPVAKAWFLKKNDIPRVFLTDDLESAHLYVFSGNNYNAHVAKTIRNLWGLGSSISLLNHNLSCDVELCSGGQYKIRHPFAILGKNHQPPSQYYYQCQFASYSQVKIDVPHGRYSFIASQHFDEPWIEVHFDEITKIPRKMAMASPWGVGFGIIRTNFARTVVEKLPTVSFGATNHVAPPLTVNSSKGPVPHPLLYPCVRDSRNALGFDYRNHQFYDNEFMFERFHGDELCHFSVIITKQLTSIILKTATRSIRRQLPRESSRTGYHHGWCVLDPSGILWNPVSYSSSGELGISPIIDITAPLFNALEKLGFWGCRPRVQARDALLECEVYEKMYWIVSYTHPSSWLAGAGSWHAPICVWRKGCSHEYKYLDVPPAGTYAFDLFAKAVDLVTLASPTSEDLPWRSVDPVLAKRNRVEF
jgi:hypothetical protein